MSFISVQHLVEQAIKLAVTFPQNFEQPRPFPRTRLNFEKVVALYSVVAMLFQGVSLQLKNGVYLCVDILISIK